MGISRPKCLACILFLATKSVKKSTPPKSQSSTSRPTLPYITNAAVPVRGPPRALNISPVLLGIVGYM